MKCRDLSRFLSCWADFMHSSQIRFNPKALLVTAVGALVFLIALQSRKVGLFDNVIGVFVWTGVVVLSIAALVGLFRHRDLDDRYRTGWGGNFG